MSEALEAFGVTRRYGPSVVVDGVTLSMAPGEITALLGGSGAGKSTLLRLLAGLEPLDAGEIRLGSRILSAPGATTPPEQRRIGLIFQDFALFPHLTAARNVGFGLRHLPRETAASRIGHWIALLDLAHRASAYPHELSGGEQQRVAIARALAPEPAAILMDEPFSGLDPALSGSVREAALSAIRSAGIPALMVTHDPAEALESADRIAILSKGILLQSGTADEVYRRPASLAAARSLGAVNIARRGAMPASWHALLPAQASQLGFRPEAIVLDQASPDRFTIMSRRLTGPLIRLTLTGQGLTLNALVPHGLAPLAGAETGVRLDPRLTFTFASEPT